MTHGTPEPMVPLRGLDMREIARHLWWVRRHLYWIRKRTEGKSNSLDIHPALNLLTEVGQEIEHTRKLSGQG